MKKAIELGHQATALDREGKFAEALDVYKMCLDHFMLVWKYEQNPAFKERLGARINEYMIRAEQLKALVQKNVCHQIFVITFGLRSLSLRQILGRMARPRRTPVENRPALQRMIN